MGKKSTFDGPSMLSAPQDCACDAFVVPSRQRPGIPGLHKLHKVGARLLGGQIIEKQSLLQPEPLAELQHRRWVNSLQASQLMCRVDHITTASWCCACTGPIAHEYLEARAGMVVPMHLLLQLQQHINGITMHTLIRSSHAQRA